jgi:hypothetical protein
MRRLPRKSDRTQDCFPGLASGNCYADEIQNIAGPAEHRARVNVRPGASQMWLLKCRAAVCFCGDAPAGLIVSLSPSIIDDDATSHAQ